MSNELLAIGALAVVCILVTPFFKDTLKIVYEKPNQVTITNTTVITEHPKKIILHNDSFLPKTVAGSEVSAYETIKYLRSRGHSVKVYVNQYYYDQYDGFPIYELKKNNPACEKDIAECDLIFFQGTKKRDMLELAQKYNKPCYVFIHVIADHSWVLQQKMPFPVTVVYNSQMTQREQPTLHRSMRMIPYVDLQRFKSIRNYTTANSLVCLINCNRNKGGHLLYELAEKMSDVQFLGVKGGYSEHIGDESLPLSNLTYIETQKDITVVYKKIGILIMPSEKETWGRTAVEAMASGVVVIHSQAEGLIESVGGAGIQCDLSDSSEWMTAIRRVLGDPAYKEQLRQRGFHRVEEIEIEQRRGRQELAMRIERV